MSKRGKFLLVLAAMVIFLSGMSGYHQLVRMTGRTVTVETEPVDPRSLFRGDYVRLSYKMNSVPCEIEPDSGKEVFVKLIESGENWVARSVRTELPSDWSDEAAYIRGYFSHEASGTCQVDYPSVESYFIPEATGEKIEKYRGAGLKVKIALASDGYPVIKKLVFPDD